MKQVPVLIGFDSTKCIGTLTIDETKLPPGDGYVFSLGYLVEKASREGSGVKIEEIELHCVSLQSDEQYMAYLKSRLPTTSEGILSYDRGWAEGQRELLDWLNRNTTYYNTDQGTQPALASVSKRIWFHATDDTESYPFGKVIDEALKKDV